MTWDPIAAKTAIKTCVAFGMALAAALYLDWLVTPAVITVQMLQSALLGIAVRNSVTRFFGACFAGFISLVILGLFPQDRFAVVLVYSVVAGFAVYRIQGSKNPYFWLIIAFGVPFIGMATGGNPNATFMQAVHVSSSFMLGGICVIIVNELLWPNPMTGLFEGGLRKALQGIQRQFALRRAALLDGDASHAEELKKIQGVELGLAGKLPALLPNAAAESRHIRRFKGNYERLIDNVMVMGVELIALADALDACMESATLRDRLASAGSVTEGLDRFDDALQKLAEQTTSERDGMDAVEDPPPPDLAGDLDPGTLDDLDRALIEALRSKSNKAWSAIVQCRHDLANVENPHAPPVEAAEPARKEPFRLGALVTSFRFRWSVFVGVVSFASAYLWLLTQWPSGLKFAILAPVIGNMMVRQWPGLQRAIVTGAALTTTLTWILYFFVLPPLPNDFWFLWPAMMVFLFPLVYLQALKSPFWATAGFMGGFAYCMLVSIENLQLFSFSVYMNSLVGLLGSIFIPAAIFTLAQRTPIERVFRHRVADFFGVCARTVREFEDGIDSPDALGRLRTRRREAVAAYQACAELTNRLPYGHVPQNSKEKVGGLVAALWSVLFRLDSVNRTRAELVRDGQLDAGADAGFRAKIANALGVLHEAAGRCERVGDQPLDLDSVREKAEAGRARLAAEGTAGALFATAGLNRSLASAIEEARDRFDTLDWRAWDLDRF